MSETETRVPEAAPDDRERALAELEARLGHRFGERAHLEAALTHRSYANELRLAEQNERLEFLGDAVLGMVAAEWLFRRLPERPEGELARAKAALVSWGPLSAFAETLGLGELLRLGVGEARSGGRQKASVLGDALEAVWGAVAVDGGVEAARRPIEEYLAWAESRVDLARSDAKTALQEWVQARGGELPVYAIVEASGPEHARTFVCEVTVLGAAAGRGEGATKKEAHQRAAAAALARLLAPDANGSARPG